MKLVFTTLDVTRAVVELRDLVVGCRVNNIYDINNKTYLVKLTKNDQKFTILFESGVRIHLTEFDWAKNTMPSGFAMKLRKHIRNKKLTNINQLGMDRIVDVQFGYDDTAYHLIVELYDRGNMLLTDHSYAILHLLRPRTDNNQDVRYAAHERYPTELARTLPDWLVGFSADSIQEHVFKMICNADDQWSVSRVDESVRTFTKCLAAELSYGQVPIEHCCRIALKCSRARLDEAQNHSDGVRSADTPETIKRDFSIHFALAFRNLLSHVYNIESVDDSGMFSGFIFVKKRKPEDDEFMCYDDFHPVVFDQYQLKPHIQFSSFNKAVDAYFSHIESQRTNERITQNEKKANKKLENIKKDHETRLTALRTDQELDVKKAQLLELNRELVDRIILMINHALSNQLDWRQLESMLDEAKGRGDLLAQRIVQMNLQFNQITIRLHYPFITVSDDDTESQQEPALDIVIDLDLNAQNNAKKYYDKKRAAVKKEEKTLIASKKALKSAAQKARQTQQDVKTLIRITKVRKPMWFEKFYWFITSENYLVVAGRDAQQNEAMVKRHLDPDDIYVHAELHGACSVIIKARPLTSEDTGFQSDPHPGHPARQLRASPPPKTLTEAGIMAVTLSSAWNARVVTSAWWVRRDQVSKTAPSGEYLTTGSFMIRGRKNYLPPCHFVYGFAILFKLDEESVANHKGERCITQFEETQFTTDSIQFEETHSLPISETEDTDENEEDVFPDAHLQLNLIKENKQIQPSHTNSTESVTIVQSGAIIPRSSFADKNKSSSADTGTTKSFDSSDLSVQSDKPATINHSALKRGHKSKLRKIKQKYGEQDDVERLLRMRLLQGEGAKLSKHHLPSPQPDLPEIVEECLNGLDTLDAEGNGDESTTLGSESGDPVEGGTSSCTMTQVNTDVSPTEQQPIDEQPEEDEDDEVDNLKRSPDDEWLRLMDTFTGQPLENDILLYALPVCAPYSVLMHYKFKVKLTPGTTKRGKAAKTALQCFLTDKTATVREKELIRVLKSEDVSRNFPGCVKLSLPQGRVVHRK